MKPLLVLGLGNSLMGDDAAGVAVTEMLAGDSTVTDRAEIWTAGADVLRSMDRIGGRERVILVDAVECGEEPGLVSVVDEPRFDENRAHAHWLSAAQAVELMRRTMPGLRRTKFTWVLVHVASVKAHEGLSADVAAAVPVAAAVVKGLLWGACLVERSASSRFRRME
ncbi:MAG: hydrogenase maturation protease [Bryobacteraceae bacterium]|jgi:hydrogenase maturation protease